MLRVEALGEASQHHCPCGHIGSIEFYRYKFYSGRRLETEVVLMNLGMLK